MYIKPGIDSLCENPPFPKTWRLAMVTNNAALTAKGVSSRLAIMEAGFHLVKLFSPEHGINTAGADGVAQPHARDAITHLPVTSLYAQNLAPTPQDLAGIDAVLFDIPDVGCRFYTYLWTMTYVMEACAAQQIAMWVLDRPNPTGGLLEQAEGPWLDEEKCSSFIGRWNMPIRHACTLGELAIYFQQTRIPKLQLGVIPCSGWTRASLLLHPSWFTPTSPAITQVQTALIYAGTAFWEGVNLHDGRGTPYPFRLFGAPWLSKEWIAAMCKDSHRGFQMTDHSFVPITGKYAGQQCNGAMLQVTDEKIYRPVASGIALLQAIARQYPQQFTRAEYPTLANPSGSRHLDLLTGQPNSFENLLGMDAQATACGSEWKKIMLPYLLYQ